MSFISFSLIFDIESIYLVHLYSYISNFKHILKVRLHTMYKGYFLKIAVGSLSRNCFQRGKS